jgi:predicted transcriptional regulator
MTTVTIGISSAGETRTRMLDAFRGEAQGEFIAFASAELLWKVITPKRRAVLRAMTGARPIAIREVARRVSRDVKSVHGDIQALVKAGVLDRTEKGGVVFPYDGCMWISRCARPEQSADPVTLRRMGWEKPACHTRSLAFPVTGHIIMTSH